MQSSDSKHLLALLPEKKEQKQSESTPLELLFGPFASRLSWAHVDLLASLYGVQDRAEKYSAI